MAVTKEHIRAWLQTAKNEGATHVIVKSDDFSHEYYPVPCFSEKEARAKAGKPWNDSVDKADREELGTMQSVIEIYNLSLDWDEQLQYDTRCHNF